QLEAAGFDVIVYLPACRAISEDGATQAVADMRQARIQIASSREQLVSLEGQ
ncbi:MAG: nicotinamidase, partial [Pseudomonas sp.]